MTTQANAGAVNPGASATTTDLRLKFTTPASPRQVLPAPRFAAPAHARAHGAVGRIGRLLDYIAHVEDVQAALQRRTRYLAEARAAVEVEIFGTGVGR
jgi:hypothetical protein